MADLTLRGQCKRATDLIGADGAAEAVVVCRRILQVFPKHIGVYSLLARAYLLLGEHETSDKGEYEQQDGMGFQASAYVQYTFPRRQAGPIPSVRLEPFVRYWDIEESSHDIDWWAGVESWEPANSTTIVGIRGSFLF